MTHEFQKCSHHYRRSYLSHAQQRILVQLNHRPLPLGGTLWILLQASIYWLSMPPPPFPSRLSPWKQRHTTLSLRHLNLAALQWDQSIHTVRSPPMQSKETSILWCSHQHITSSLLYMQVITVPHHTFNLHQHPSRSMLHENPHAATPWFNTHSSDIGILVDGIMENRICTWAPDQLLKTDWTNWGSVVTTTREIKKKRWLSQHVALQHTRICRFTIWTHCSIHWADPHADPPITPPRMPTRIDLSLNFPAVNKLRILSTSLKQSTLALTHLTLKIWYCYH